MQRNYYPSKRELRRIAQRAHAHVEFLESEDILFRNGPLTRKIRRLLPFGLDRRAALAMRPLFQRYMVLRARGPAGPACST